MPFKYNALLGLGLDNTIPLDGAGKIPSTFLPSYVDDVEEYNNLAAFPATGETGKIYVAIDTGFVYRWSGSVYVQIGITAAAGSTTQVQFNDGGAFGGDSGLTFDKTTDALSAGGFIPTSSTVPANGIYLPAANSVGVATIGVGRVFATSAGLVGIGDSAPDALLTVNGVVSHGAGSASAPSIAARGDLNTGIFFPAADTIAFAEGGTEVARMDSSGRLLVGTSTARVIEPYGLGTDGQTSHTYESVGDSTPGPGIALGSSETTDRFGPYLYLFRSRGGSVGSNTIVSSGDNLGTISFAGADGTDVRTRGAAIYAEVDGTPGANDMPGRLVFSTTSDSASSPTERLRITSAGVLQVADAGNITVGTTTGTKIGTATTQKIGFYNATPVVQPAAVADATDAASGIARLNDLLARLRTLGIIAT